MTTRREQILQELLRMAQAVPGVESDSVTRERSGPIMANACPALDIVPDSEADPELLGGNADRHTLTISLRVHTAGDGGSANADPLIEAFHRALFGSEALSKLVTTVLPGSTEFSRDESDPDVSQTIAHYHLVFLARRDDLTRKPI